MKDLFFSATDCVLKTNDTHYNGTVNITKSNYTCRRWEKASDDKYHVLEDNYCRNPSFHALDNPWCYTGKVTPYYETCDIPLCGTLLILTI